VQASKRQRIAAGADEEAEDLYADVTATTVEDTGEAPSSTPAAVEPSSVTPDLAYDPAPLTAAAPELAAPVAAGGGRSTSDDPIGEAIRRLPPVVVAKLDKLYQKPGLGPDDLELCCIDSLKDFSEEEAVGVCDKFDEADLAEVRSKTAFFIGILKRFRAERNNKPAGGYPGYADAWGQPMPAYAAAYANPQQWAPPIAGGTQEDQEREAAIARVPWAVRQRLEALFGTGNVQRCDIAPCCIDSLKDFDEWTCCDIIDKLNEADWGTVRNKTAFFIGVLKRFRANGQAGKGGAAFGAAAAAPMPMPMPMPAAGGYAGGYGGGFGGGYPAPAWGGGGAPAPRREHAPPAGQEDKQRALDSLAEPIKVKMTNMFNMGFCSMSDLEPCCIDSLKDFSEQTAIEIIDKFMEADMSTIRNKTAYFIGVLKRYRTPGGGGGGGGGKGGGGSYGGAAPSYGGAAPSYGGAAPSYGGAAPSYGGAAPSYGGAAPSYGGAAPSYGGAAPSYGGAAPSYGGAAPSYGGAAPSYGGAAPSYGGAAPSYGGAAPSYGGAAPSYGGAAPSGGYGYAAPAPQGAYGGYGTWEGGQAPQQGSYGGGGYQ